VQDSAKLAAIVAEAALCGALSWIDAKFLADWIIADVTGLNDDEVFTMVGVRPMPVGRNLAADLSVIEGERSEMLHDQNYRITLALVRTEGARGHHQRALEAKRQAVIVEPRDKQAVPHRALAELKIVDHMAHRVFSVSATVSDLLLVAAKTASTASSWQSRRRSRAAQDGRPM
jgi:hypothetical protein